MSPSSEPESVLLDTDAHPDAHFSAYQTLVDNAPDGIARLDRDLRFLYANPAIEAEAGVSPRLLLGKGPDELDGLPDPTRVWRSQAREVFETGTERLVDYMLDHSARGPHYYQARLVPEFAPDGSVASVLAVSRDITALKRAEETFIKSFQASPDAIIIAQLHDGQVIDANESCLQLLGYRRDEIVGHPLTTLAFWVDPARRQGLEELTRAQGSVRDWEFPFRRKSGEIRLGLLSTEVIALGPVPCSLMICRDITDREALAAAREREHQLYLATVRSLAAAVDARDAYTHSHSRQVAFYSRLIADVLGLSEEEVETIELAGLLHDIGKIAIPDTILQKPGRLTPEEAALMRTHAARGAAIVGAGKSPALEPIVPMIRHHHERWDGTGYPDGLAEAAIPLGAAVIAVADALDTMTTPRPYKPARTLDAACAEITRLAGSQFHPTVAAALSQVIARDRAAEADYIADIERGTEPDASALTRLSAVTGSGQGTPGPESVSYQEQQRLAAHRQSLYQIARGFDDVTDEARIVAVADRLAQDHLGAESIFLAELQDRQGLPLAPGSGQDQPVGHIAARRGRAHAAPFVPFTVRVGEELAGGPLLIAATQPIAVPEVSRDATALSDVLCWAAGWHSGILIPLRAGGEVLGLLGIGYQSGHTSFGGADLELAQALGAAAARALAGIQLQYTAAQLRRQLTALESRNQMLARYASELAVLSAMARSLGTLFDVETICRQVVQVLAAPFAYALVSVALLEDGALRFRAWTDPAPVPADPWPLTAGVSGRVMRTGQPALVPDVTQDPDYITLKAGIRSEICVPLVGRAGALGVVTISSSAPEPLGEDDLRLLITLTPQIAIALENTHLQAATSKPPAA